MCKKGVKINKSFFRRVLCLEYFGLFCGVWRILALFCGIWRIGYPLYTPKSKFKKHLVLGHKLGFLSNKKKCTRFFISNSFISNSTGVFPNNKQLQYWLLGVYMH